MSARFDKLHKVPQQPAARLLASAGAKLKAETKSPANASVTALMAELEAMEARVDMARLMSVALPAREAVWWACLAARDVVAKGDSDVCLKAAEAWVFDPTTENRQRVQIALEAADTGDKTVMAATAAQYAPGNLSDAEEMRDIAAPVGIVANCAFGMNLKSLKVDKDPNARLDLLIDRAIDIARGGNGNVAPPETAQTEGADNDAPPAKEDAS